MEINKELFTSSILECITSSVVVLDGSLNIIYMNTAAETIFGTTYKHVKHKAFHHIVELSDLDQTALTYALTTFQPFSINEAPFSLLNRQKIHVDYTVSPNQLPDGQVILVLEINQVDRRLRIVREEALLDQQKATKMLVRSLAHEVKNPLGGLRGAAQLLESELESDELKEYTNIIIREADRLKNLMNRMLGPNARPKFLMVNIHDVTERVRKLLLADLPKKISLIFDYDPSIPEFLGDSDWLVQAVLNIASNAIQAIEGEGKVIIKTRVLRNFTIGKNFYKLLVRLQVIDNGLGVPDEMQEKIFYPMITTKAEGTGLGLSIAQSLVNEHKGLIEYERINDLSVFSIMLPIEVE